MSIIKIASIGLIVVGILGLVYGGFSYTKETHNLKVGSLEISVQDKQMIAIPIVAGVGAIGLGVILLVLERRKI